MPPLKINRQLILAITPEQAFKKFIYLQDWWPVEYTWSKAVLKTVSIEQKAGGFFYEESQQGFRLDWGTVLQWKVNEQLIFLWQIAPGSIPEPNPDKASIVQVDFIAQNEGTLIKLEHQDFEHYGAKAEEFFIAMDSTYGWTYLLSCYEKQAITL